MVLEKCLESTSRRIFFVEDPVAFTLSLQDNADRAIRSIFDQQIERQSISTVIFLEFDKGNEGSEVTTKAHLFIPTDR